MPPKFLVSVPSSPCPPARPPGLDRGQQAPHWPLPPLLPGLCLPHNRQVSLSPPGSRPAGLPTALGVRPELSQPGILPLQLPTPTLHLPSLTPARPISSPQASLREKARGGWFPQGLLFTPAWPAALHIRPASAGNALSPGSGCHLKASSAGPQAGDRGSLCVCAGCVSWLWGAGDIRADSLLFPSPCTKRLLTPTSVQAASLARKASFSPPDASLHLPKTPTASGPPRTLVALPQGPTFAITHLHT